MTCPTCDSLSPTQDATQRNLEADSGSHHTPTAKSRVANQIEGSGSESSRPTATMTLRRCSGAVLLAFAAAVLLLAAAAVPGAAGFHLGGDESGLVRGMLAAIREQAEAEDAARFAVAEHNKNQGSALEFARVVSAKRQVVAGTLHDLMLEVVDAGKKSLYKAKVWVKPWQDFKAVVEFRHAVDSQSESSVPSDGSIGQAMPKFTLQDHMAPKTHMHINENNELSVDSSSSSSQTYTV